MGARLSDLKILGREPSFSGPTYYAENWGGPHGPLATGTLLVTSGTAYWVFLGVVIKRFTPAYVNFHCSTAGAGAQTAEMGLYSSVNAPNGANQTITPLVTTGSVTSLTGTGVKRNSAAFTTVIGVGVYLWAGVRTAMATTQPTFNALLRDYARGNVLTTGASGVLTGAGPWTGATIAATAATSEAPVAWWSYA